MHTRTLWTAFWVASACLATAAAAERDPVVPTTTPPIVYTINYSGEYFQNPEYVEQFKGSPPDLLHVGKAVPIAVLRLDGFRALIVDRVALGVYVREDVVAGIRVAGIA